MTSPDPIPPPPRPDDGGPGSAIAITEGKFRRTFRLIDASWRLLGSDPKLLLLPAGSFLSIFAVAGLFFTLGPRLGFYRLGDGHTILHFVSLYALYAAIAFIGICFDATLVGVALLRLNGRSATVRDGWMLVWARIGAVLRWAALAATVGIVIRALQERTGVFGWVVGLIGNITWSLVTFFVVPVLLFEPVDVRGAIKRSAGIFRKRWGEQIIANVTIGTGLFALLLPVTILAVWLMFLSVWLGIAVLIAGMSAVFAIGGALTSVFNTALYRYVVAGNVPEGFTALDFENAIKPRKRWARRSKSGERATPPRPDL
jgi:hypothetical protein